MCIRDRDMGGDPLLALDLAVELRLAEPVSYTHLDVYKRQALGGSTFGMAEETVAFWALIVPVMMAAGFDRMVAAGIIDVYKRQGRGRRRGRTRCTRPR